MLLLALWLFTSAAYSATKTVIVLGDSLSAEYGIERGTGWVALMQRKLNAEKIDTVLINSSISGETTSGGKARLQALLDKHRPDLVIIELGSNDALRGLPISATEANLNAMITTAKNARAKVLLIGMKIPPNYGADYTQKFSSLYAKQARLTKSPLVPFLLAGVADKPELFQADRLHPNANAHPIIMRNVWPHLKPLLVK